MHAALLAVVSVGGNARGVERGVDLGPGALAARQRCLDDVPGLLDRLG
jgi:hypothetical protein